MPYKIEIGKPVLQLDGTELKRTEDGEEKPFTIRNLLLNILGNLQVSDGEKAVLLYEVGGRVARADGEKYLTLENYEFNTLKSAVISDFVKNKAQGNMIGKASIQQALDDAEVRYRRGNRDKEGEDGDEKPEKRGGKKKS